MNVSTDPRLATMEKLNNPLEEVTLLMREVISELKGIKREVSRLSSTVATALRERSSATLGDLYNPHQMTGMEACGLSSVASSSICGIDESIKSPTPRFDIDEDIKGLEDGFVQISMKCENESKLAKTKDYIKLLNEKLLNMQTTDIPNNEPVEQMTLSGIMEQNGGILAPFFARYNDAHSLMRSSQPSPIFFGQQQESMTKSNILQYDPVIDLDKWLLKTRA